MRLMDHSNTTLRAHWLGVGLKLLLGAALASNMCIGALLLVNQQMNRDIEQRTSALLSIHNRMGDNLRAAIVRMQEEFIRLPQRFVDDPKQVVLDQVEREFVVKMRQQLVGREQYGSLYDRTQRRDLANGKVISGLDHDGLVLSFGLTDKDGVFLEQVERWQLVSTRPDEDRERLRLLIEAAAAPQTSAAVVEKMALLRDIAADKSIEAEKSRTEILGLVDAITLEERRMAEAGQQQRRAGLIAGLAAILANVFFLYVLTRIIVERPLHRLTIILEELGSGKSPAIPWPGRRDQIGVLAAAIGRFRDVQLALKTEEARKEQDRLRIDTLVATMAEAIHQLDQRAAQMAEVSRSLQDLAETGEQQAHKVAELAEDTAQKTQEASTCSRRISEAVLAIYQVLGAQSGEVVRMGDEIARARQQVAALEHAVQAIDTLVGSVHDISDQTKILAINAAIEAVKAGEHGRGFGVVADEVKQLSQNTAIATRDVLEKTGAIKATCQSFIACFDVLEGCASHLHRSTGAIGQTVDTQKNLAASIVALAATASANTHAVSAGMREISGAAVGVRRFSSETHRCAQGIAALLTDLQQGAMRGQEEMGGQANGETARHHGAQAEHSVSGRIVSIPAEGTDAVRENSLVRAGRSPSFEPV